MSGFDPFPDPFSDPSITKETQNQNNQSSLVDDYNPFANKTTYQNEPAILPENSISTTSVSTNQPPLLSTNSTTNSVQNITQNELQRRQEELERKAAELAAKEEALRNLEGTVKPPNWPPLPSFCPFGPCLYQDINVEIRPEFQRIVRYAYYLWMSFVLVLFINLLGNLVFLLNSEGYVRPFLSSIITLPIFAPLSFMFLFRPLYKAFKNDSSFNFMIFFFVFFCQLVLSVLWGLGITAGSCGLITLTQNLEKGPFVTFFLVFVTFSLILYAFASLLFLLQVHSIYRHTGASMEKAQAEFTSSVLNNQQVQNETRRMAANAMGNMFSNTSSNTEPRY